MTKDDISLFSFSGLTFSQMKNCEIVDNTEEKVGRLIDAIFRISPSGLHLTKFVVGGSFFEELLEDLGVRKDVDPVFPVSVIDSITPKRICLNVLKSELKSTAIHEDAIEEDEIRLSNLSKMKIYDKSEEHIGNIIDMKFYDNSFKFIVGDGFFRELIEDIGLVADVDLLLQPKSIYEVTNKSIRLNQDRAELKKTFDKHMPEYDQLKSQADDQRESINRVMYLP